MRLELKDKSKWHKWFSWHPVYVENHEMVWLQWVERRIGYSWPRPCPVYYRLPEKEPSPITSKIDDAGR